MMLKCVVGMAFGGSEQISFYWLLNWPSRGTNRREAEQWTVEEKEGHAQDFKGSEHLIGGEWSRLGLLDIWGTQTNILKCKENLY